MNWTSLLTTPVLIILGLCAIVILAVIGVAVVSQGREISFWPPRILAKGDSHEIRFKYKAAEVSGLIGEWFEEIPNSPDRYYSIGVFKHDRDSGNCTYDGTNFRTTGEPFCTWRSRVVIVDTPARQVLYIFDACVEGEMHATNTGFGVLHLVIGDSGALSSNAGYYIEAKDEGKPFTHTMRPLDTVARELGISRTANEHDQFYRRVINAHQAKVGQRK